MRRLVAVLLVVVTTSGCLGMTRQHRGKAAVADVMAIGGLLLVARNAGCETREPMRDQYGFPTEVTGFDCLDEDLAVAGGVGLLAIGAIIGATLLADEAERSPAEQVSGPVVTVTPGPTLAELPPGRVDDQTMQLAKQARRAYAAGDCAGTRASLDALAAHDAAYHAELVGVTGYGGFARCL